MCGIAGFIDRAAADPQGVCARMISVIAHRGPDDFGYWGDRNCGIALGHRRLSIVDLSPAGHQPMASAGGRYQLIFNGEIYNHTALRREMESNGAQPRWRGHSDTETLLAAIEAWGVVAALERCVGMFALALWDRQQRRLVLARDRLGEKPLYYGRCASAFLFGSELKALQAHPSFHAELDRGSLALFLRFCYVPDPRSIFRGVHKLLPGTMLEVDEHGQYGEPKAYWNPAQVLGQARTTPFAGTDSEAIDALEHLLGEAVAGQMVADVPLGAFLSGGVDSSLIAALMQRRSAQPIKTFTIGFTEPAYNEADHARAVARHLGTDHTELIVTPRETIDVIPRLPQMYDEPFADSSQIPTFLVSELARRHVTVTLSGDAGDELFGGYNRYAWAKRLWRGMDSLPSVLRTSARRVIRTRPAEAWTRTFRFATPLLPRRWRAAHVGDKLHKLADLMATSPGEVYWGLVSHWPQPGALVGVNEPQARLQELMHEQSDRSFEEDMMYWDLLTYLPGDILVKVDRASMAVSLESRVPMLDHRVVEFAWRLPLVMRVRNGEGKWLLKQLLYRHVPRALIDRPKTGFGIPIETWLRGPLREWGESLLDATRLRNEGFFDPQPIRAKWLEHLGGQRNWSYWLWDVLMFQAWWQSQSAGSARAASAKPPTARAVQAHGA